MRHMTTDNDLFAFAGPPTEWLEFPNRIDRTPSLDPFADRTILSAYTQPQTNYVGGFGGYGTSGSVLNGCLFFQTHPNGVAVRFDSLNGGVNETININVGWENSVVAVRVYDGLTKMDLLDLNTFASRAITPGDGILNNSFTIDGQFYRGKQALLYDRALTDSEIRLTLNALKNKWPTRYGYERVVYAGEEREVDTTRNTYPIGHTGVPSQVGMFLDYDAEVMHDPNCPNESHSKLQMQAILMVDGSEFYWPRAPIVGEPDIDGWQEVGGFVIMDRLHDHIAPHIVNNGTEPLCRWFIKNDVFKISM